MNAFGCVCVSVGAFNQAPPPPQSRWQGCSNFLVNKLANYGHILKFKVSIEASWQNTSLYHVKVFWKSLLLTLDIILGYLEAKFKFGYWTKLQDCILEQEEEEEEEEQ